MALLTVILAGGASRRMGRDKALLPYGGVTLLRRQIARYAHLGPVAVCVDRAGRYPLDGATELLDAAPGQGPMNGLLAGFRQTDAEELFLTAVDLPLGDPALALRLRALRGGADACVPVGPMGPEPLLAVYGRSCLPVAEALLREGRNSMRSLLDRVRVRYVNFTELPDFDPAASLRNINTREDYQLLIKEQATMADVLEVKPRAEGDAQFQWDTSHIFAQEQDWETALERCGGYAACLAEFEGKLGGSAADLLDYLRLGEEIRVELGKIVSYANLRADEDTAVAAEQERVAKAQSLAVALATADAFATPELIAIPDETLEGFFREMPELERYRIALGEIRRRRAHILSDREEALLAAAGEMAAAPYNVFSLFESADLKFPDAEDGAGEKHPMTNGSFIPLLRSPDRVLRENAFRGYYGVWMGMKNTAAALLNAQFKQLQFYAGARRYGGSLEASLDGTNVPVSAYENLLEAVHANLPALHKYMALRKKLMGVDALHMYDIYTTLVPAAEVKIPYAEAKETVKEALGVLGEDYVAVLQRAFDERWIDVYENEGKRSGAYSCDVPGVHPYVLLNHKDTLDSLFTLAHELGHSMHSWLSDLRQPVVYADYVMFVAEVASTVNEALLMQHLLKRTSDRTERAYLINYFLEQFRTTVYRQTMFAEFEKRCGELVGQGGSLTAEKLNELYLDLNRIYYGEATEVDPEIAVEWARIPHFYYDYYVFQYATGFSAAMAISRRILTEGESAVEDYKRFLSSGCTLPPVELLKLAGVDMTTPEPVNAALAQFAGLIDELDALLG